jgi:transposase
MTPRTTTRYSEAFKLNVVRELESGRFQNVNQAARAYQIRGSRTIGLWLRKFGRIDLMPRKVLVSTMKEHDEKKALEKRVRELERALADTHMRGLLGDAYLEIACERLGVEPEEFKKKAATSLSAVPTKGPRILP